MGQKHKLVVVMRDNAGENKSHEIIEYFESIGVKNYFSTANEQWQNGLPESAINSIMMLSRTIMAESELGGRFWFKSALAGCEARNVTYKERIGTTPWKLMHGVPRDVSKFRAFGCRAWVYLNSERRDKGKHTPRAVQAINLGFEPNTSAYSFYIPEKSTIIMALCHRTKRNSMNLCIHIVSRRRLNNSSRTTQQTYYSVHRGREMGTIQSDDM